MSQTADKAVTAETPAIEKEVKESIAIIYITPDKAEFSETEGHMLSLKFDGKDYPRVQLHRSFPHTNNNKYISVREFDNDNNATKEVGIIKDLFEFDKKDIDLLNKFLDIRYFAPVITKLMNVKDEFGYTFWETQTTQGACRFVVRKDSKSIINVTGNEVLIVDVDGNRFVIPDISALSERELKLIELYI